MGKCLQCNKWVIQPKGKKEKKFCNDTCRSNYRYAKNKKQKVDFVKPSAAQFDSPKLPDNYIADEPLSFDKLKKVTPVQKGVMEYQTDLDQAEDAAALERIGRQIERSSLSWRDKQYLKAYGNAIYQKKFGF